MKFDKSTKILIVGLGLIGGSYAQALKSKGYEVGAIDLKESAVAYALEKGYIDHGRSFADPKYIHEFDMLVFALYPHTFIEWIKENQKHIKPGAILTDVTGVKKSVVYAVQDILRNDIEFIGAHPMAGREVSGVENADMNIFRDANYIVTPTEKNTPNAVEVCKRLGEEIGFKKISELTPESHDEMIGFLSQLTHCIAVSLMVCKQSEHLVDYTGDSFRDLTRISRINDEMWSELFMLNKQELLKQMDLFSEKFAMLRKTIAQDDIPAMRQMMKESTKRRKYFDR